MNSDRRYKIVQVNPDLMIDVLNWCRNPDHSITLPITEELPADTTVVGIQYCFVMDCFELKVHSSDFESVPDGAEIPQAGFIKSFHTIEAKKDIDELLEWGSALKEAHE
jgi:hypothetical protein